METKWYCFLFWFSYRFTLACLAHFNWCMSIYTNCVYFTLWKSYDLLWFWMHLILCSCFPQLRRENYLVVWSNLIIKKLTKYPDYSFKQLYYALYTTTRSTHFTKRLMSRREKKGVIELNSDSEEDETIEPTISNQKGIVSDIETQQSNVIRMSKYAEKVTVPDPVQEVPEFEQDSDQENEDNQNEKSPLRPPRPIRGKTSNISSAAENADQVIEIIADNELGENGETSPISNISEPKWKTFVPNSVMKFLPRSDSSTLSIQSKTSNEAGSTTSAFSRLYGRFKNNRNSSTSRNPYDEIDLLYPNYSNRYDIKDRSKQEAREKRDRKALRHRIRNELRMQMKIDAANEKARKKVTDAIELLLQLLRMMASFAMLIGNIRKTFIPAQFKYLQPGQNAYDKYELILLFRFTAFLDIAMFWMNVSYVYCLQWQLCCRLGCMRFLCWSTILGVVSMTVMFIPMTYVMNDLDLSWCRLMPNTTFSKYQPKW